MTSIEKKTINLTLFKTVSIAVALVTCTWRLSTNVTNLVNKIDSLDVKINILVKDREQHAKQDSIKDTQIARLSHRIDSDEKVLSMVAIKTKTKASGIKYFRERRVNGRIITEEVND